MLILVFIVAFATIVGLVWTTTMLFQEQEDAVGDRLAELQNNALVAAPRATQRRKAGDGFLNRFVFFISMIPGADGWIHENEKKLARAGVRSQAAISVFVVSCFVAMVILMGGMAWLQRGNTPVQMMGGMAAAFIIGFMGPSMVVGRMEKRYRRKLQEALPDTVDLLGIVLGTGLALDQAMVRVSDEMQYIYPELSSEFYTVVMQVRAGQDRAKCFQQLVRRTGIEDIKSLAAMIIQSERFGTSLAQALKVYADALRTRRTLRAEAAVGKAGIKMLFPIVIFILPALFVITLAPGVLSALHDLKMLGGGASSASSSLGK
jgi:tight adherence protein C